MTLYVPFFCHVFIMVFLITWCVFKRLGQFNVPAFQAIQQGDRVGLTAMAQVYRSESRSGIRLVLVSAQKWC